MNPHQARPFVPDEPLVKVRFQGIDLTPEQVTLLRNVMREAVSEYDGLECHAGIVELHRMLRPVFRPFDPRAEYRVGGGGPIPVGISRSPSEAEVDEAWLAYDRSRRG